MPSPKELHRMIIRLQAQRSDDKAQIKVLRQELIRVYLELDQLKKEAHEHS